MQWWVSRLPFPTWNSKKRLFVIFWRSGGVSERQAEPLNQLCVCFCVLEDEIQPYTSETYWCVCVCRWNKICNKCKQSSWGCVCANRWNKIFHEDKHDTWIYCSVVCVCVLADRMSYTPNDNPSTWSYCWCVSVLAAKEVWLTSEDSVTFVFITCVSLSVQEFVCEILRSRRCWRLPPSLLLWSLRQRSAWLPQNPTCTLEAKLSAK